ncbi:MAG: hypothetical protein H6605_08080 [Flavobacteriales bacterium]|nr:hypothetical protein [Flavobacteriales bacterium]
MLLIAESGSTKCDWILIDRAGNRTLTHTMGFNPFFHNEDIIESELIKNELLFKNAGLIESIRFYGAGASSEARNKIVENGLRRVFRNNADIVVDHDLKAAAISTANDNPGIACILGTGSNSCYFDGKDVMEMVPALGYILGDEGSGAYFGKIMLTKYLYHKLPIEIAEDLEKEYGINKEKIFDGVYNKPNPNVYLASFMKFVYKHREHPFFKDLLYKGLSSFISIHVWCYQNYREVPVHFVGSIAYLFKDTLEEVARNFRFNIGQIIRKPADNLADYYCKKLGYPMPKA